MSAKNTDILHNLNLGEKERIYAAGGTIEGYRVCGNLALTRAIGDFKYKRNPDIPPEKQVITALPDVMVHKICDDDEFLVIACDGTATSIFKNFKLTILQESGIVEPPGTLCYL
jgi:serine/threonine protein phosphatase PrpC